MTNTIFCIKSDVASIIIGYLGCVFNGVMLFITTSVYTFHGEEPFSLPVLGIYLHYDDVLTYLIIRSIVAFLCNFLLVVGVCEKNHYCMLPYLIESTALTIFWSGLISLWIKNQDNSGQAIADSFFIGAYVVQLYLLKQFYDIYKKFQRRKIENDRSFCSDLLI